MLYAFVTQTNRQTKRSDSVCLVGLDLSDLLGKVQKLMEYRSRTYGTVLTFKVETGTVSTL